MSFQIEQEGNDAYLHLSCGRLCLVHLHDIEEMRDHFWRERDTELGRWRHPDHPDYVVYPQAAREDNPRCLVLHEPTGETNLITRRQVTSGVISVSQADIVARDYFLAHEEPKPWHDAAPGEVWEITYGGERQYALVDEDCDFVISDDVAGPTWMSMRHTAISAGRRVLEAL